MLCGKTWLDGFAQVNQQYTAAPLEALQVITWDDYEEGTELETGIDNHLAVTPNPVQGSTLSWNVGLASDAPSECAAAVSGGWNIEDTIHHYAVLASPASDGQNLAVVASNVPAGTHQLDLTNKLPAGNYLIYVEAIGQPSIHNHMSAPISYTVAGAAAATVTIVSPVASSVVGSSGHVGASATASVAINQLQVCIRSISVALS